MSTEWRVGRKVGRTIYKQNEEEPSDHDDLIGMMDNRSLALLVVVAVNGLMKLESFLNEEMPYERLPREGVIDGAIRLLKEHHPPRS